MNNTIKRRENITEQRANENVIKESSSLSAKGILQVKQEERAILSDRSNRYKRETTGLLKSSKIPGGNKIKVYNDDKTSTNKREDTQYVSKEDKEAQEKAIQDELVRDFFEDNATRYKEEESRLFIVPIRPIVVPDEIKAVLKKNNFTQPTTTAKRAHEEENETEEHHKRVKVYQQKYFAHDAPPIELYENDEAVAYDKVQELRSTNLMLQSKSLLQEIQGNDPMMMAEYAEEIFEQLRLSETDKMADPNYADLTQHEISWSTRGVLIDWMIEIHYLFSLLPETLFLAVNIIDRFLSKRTVVLGKLQLVGAAALIVAIKFEEMYCPALEDFLNMTGGSIEEDELVRAECFILQVLDFRLCYANPLNFLRRLLAEDTTADVYTRILSKYFMEVCFIDHRHIGVKPSLVAAASLCLARKMLGRTKWTPELEELSGYKMREIKPVVEDILDYLSQPVVHDAFFKKWTSKRLSKASIFVRDWINRYYLTQ